MSNFGRSVVFIFLYSFVLSLEHRLNYVRQNGVSIWVDEKINGTTNSTLLRSYLLVNECVNSFPGSWMGYMILSNKSDDYDENVIINNRRNYFFQFRCDENCKVCNSTMDASKLTQFEYSALFDGKPNYDFSYILDHGGKQYNIIIDQDFFVGQYINSLIGFSAKSHYLFSWFRNLTLCELSNPLDDRNKTFHYMTSSHFTAMDKTHNMDPSIHRYECVSLFINATNYTCFPTTPMSIKGSETYNIPVTPTEDDDYVRYGYLKCYFQNETTCEGIQNEDGITQNLTFIDYKYTLGKDCFYDSLRDEYFKIIAPYMEPYPNCSRDTTEPGDNCEEEIGNKGRFGVCLNNGNCACFNDLSKEQKFCSRENTNNSGGSPFTEDEGSRSGYELLVAVGIPLILLLVFLSCSLCLLLFVFLIGGFCFSSTSTAFIIRKNKKLRNEQERKSEWELSNVFSDEINSKESFENIKIQEKLFTIQPKEIVLSKRIGAGASGQVYKATWNGQEVACKSIVLTEGDPRIFDEFQSEISFLSTLKFPNIISFYGAALDFPRILMIMEFCENGDLKKFLLKYKRRNDQAYPQKMRMLEGIISGMCFIHEKNVIHRDLKCENVLVSSSEVCKIMDFGLSKALENDKSMTKGIGSSFYMSPELIRGESYDFKVDTYSWSILCYCVLSDQFDPYQGLEGIEYKVANNPSFRPKLSSLGNCRKWIPKLLRACWSDDQQQRPSFKEIKETWEKHTKEEVNVYLSRKVQNGEEEQQEQDAVLKEMTIQEVKNLIEKEEGTEWKRIGKLFFEDDIEIVHENQLQLMKEDSIIYFSTLD